MQSPTFYVREIPIYGDLILSPMDGFSDLPFRSLCRELGSAMSYTEFVNVDELQGKKGGSKRAYKKLEYAHDERPIVFQIYGHDVDRLVETAVRLQERGPDIIDINMGCYVKKISERGAGAGMLRYPDRIASLFRRLSQELDIPTTGKIRLGWDADERNYLDVAHAIADNGSSLLAVHGRTRAQAYKGAADWDAIAEIKAALSIPVIGNGDVTSVADIENIKAHTGCDGVMIGRGAIGNPWIFSRKDRQDVLTSEKVNLVRKHLAANLEFYGQQLGLILFRKHIARYVPENPRDREWRLRLLTCERADEFVALVEGQGASISQSPTQKLPLAV